MERKIGETFEFEGKWYVVVESKSNSCSSCAFKGGCADVDKVVGACVFRSDMKRVIFKEIKKDMEIKDNKLTINIPEGMEIDIQNSNLKVGVIKFKKKEIDYLDVCTSLGSDSKLLPITITNCEKVKAIDKLIDIANYYNRGWKPNWSNKDELKFYIAFDAESSYFTVKCRYMMSYNIVYFKNRKDAQAVIDNHNFREILDVIFKN